VLHIEFSEKIDLVYRFGWMKLSQARRHSDIHRDKAVKVLLTYLA